MHQGQYDDIGDSVLIFSSNDEAKQPQILLSVKRPISGLLKFKIDGEALTFLQRQILEVSNIDRAIQILNASNHLQFFCKVYTSSKTFIIYNEERQFQIKSHRQIGSYEESEQLQHDLQVQLGCLKIIEYISRLNKEQFYAHESASIGERLIRKLQPMPNIHKTAMKILKAYFQKTSSTDVKVFKENITPPVRIRQGQTSSKQYIFHPTFVTVDMFAWILKDSAFNFFITGRSGMGKSNSFIFYSAMTTSFEQIRLKNHLYPLQKKIQRAWLKVPKIVYLYFQNQEFDYYKEIIKQLPNEGPDGIIAWTKSSAIFRQIKQFYQHHEIPFKLVLDQINIYTSLVREQVNCKTCEQPFEQKQILDQIQEIIKKSKRLSVIYCSSNNIERNLFIGNSFKSNRATVSARSDDITVKEVSINYEQYQNTYRGFVETVNAILFQLRLRCDQTKNVKQIQQLLLKKLRTIHEEQFKEEQGYHSESILTFHMLNTQFTHNKEEIFKFIEQNKDQEQFLQAFLKYFKTKSLWKQIQKYSQFLKKGDQSTKYERLLLFQKLAHKARQIVKTDQTAESKFSFSLTLILQKQLRFFIDNVNMDNTLVEGQNASAKLTIFYPPQTFLFISRNVQRDESIYTRIVEEALKAISGFEGKFGQIIDPIYTKLISLEDSILMIGDQLFHITGENLSFVHFSAKSINKKGVTQIYDIMKHFGKIIKALEKDPKTNDKYYGAYPALMPVTDKGEWQETQQSKYTSCSWCIDALIANNDEKDQGKYNIISFDFTAGHNFTKTYQKYQKSAKFFNKLHEINADQFQKFNIVHKIIVLQSHMSSIEKRMKKDEGKYKVPKNVKIEFNSLSKFDFIFSEQKASTERRIYKLIKKKLQETDQSNKNEEGKGNKNKP